jgi:malonyl-ACP O-methyltransferase BioC
MNKQRIAHRFSSAISTYDKAAVEQRHIANQLFRMLLDFYRQHNLPTPRYIAEIGCGTGILSRLLHTNFTPDSLYLNDLCAEVAPLFKDWSNTIFVAADAESAEIPKDNDLIATSSVIQWFDAPLDFLLGCKKYLSADGILALSSFGPNNFRQIKELTGRGLHYYTLGEMVEALAPHYEIIVAREEEIEQSFSSPSEVLRNLKETGVTGLSGGNILGEEDFRWSRAKLNSFCNSYIERYPAKYVGPEAVTLTYHPIYLILKRK